MDERTVNLWRYLPEFLKQYRELDALFQAEQPEFQTLVHNQIIEFNDFFIETATQEGLKRFEKILGIYPNPGDSIEIRRKNIMVHWYTHDVYTLLTLKNRLSMLQGNDNIQLTWNEDDPFLLHVVTRLELKGQVDTLYQILESMLPANIAYDSDNYIEFNETFTIFYGAGLVGTGTLFLTDDFKETVGGALAHYIGSGMSISGSVFGTNDFNETVNADLSLYYASGIVGTGIFFLTDNFNESVEISGNTFVGMANGYTEFISTH